VEEAVIATKVSTGRTEAAADIAIGVFGVVGVDETTTTAVDNMELVVRMEELTEATVAAVITARIAMSPAATVGAPLPAGLDGGRGGSGLQWRVLPVMATSAMKTAAAAASSVAEETAGVATVWPADCDTKTKKHKSNWKRRHLR